MSNPYQYHRNEIPGIMTSYLSVEQQTVNSNDGKPTSSEDGRTVYIKTQVHPHHRQELDQVLSCYPWDWSKAEEMIGKTCDAQAHLSKTKTKNLIIEKDNNYLKIVARGTTTVPAQFILEGNSSRQEVLKFQKLPPVTKKFVDKLHKTLRVLAVKTKVEFNGKCDIKKYGKVFNEETMKQKIEEDKTPDAQLATLHCLYQHILTLNECDGRQIEDRILLPIIVAMKDLKSDIVRSTQKWLRTLVLKYFMFVQRYYSFGKLSKGDSYSTVNTYERLLVLSKDDLYGCYMVVACINHVKGVLNFQPDVKEQLFRKYTMSDRELEATEDNLFFQTFWEECYKDAMKKLIKTPQEIHLKKHEAKMKSEKLKKQSMDVPPTQLNSKPPALELGLAELEEELGRLGGTYEEACERGRENYRSQHGCAVTNELCFVAGEVAGAKFTHYKNAYDRKKITQTAEMMAQEVVAPNQEEVAYTLMSPEGDQYTSGAHINMANPSTAAALAKENNNDGDDSTVDPKDIDIELGGGDRVVLPSSSPPSRVVVDHLSKEREEDEDDDTDNSTLISARVPSKKREAPKKKTRNLSDPLKKTNGVVPKKSPSTNEPKEKMATVGSDKFCKRTHNILDDARECAYDDMKPLEQKHYFKKFQIEYSTCSIGGVKCLLKAPSTKFKSISECHSLKQNFGQYLKDTGVDNKDFIPILVERFETVTCAGSNRIFGEVDDSKLYTKLKYCQLCIHPQLDDNEPRVNPSAACMSCIEDLEERRNEKERGVVTDSSAKRRKRMPRRKRTQNK